MVLHSLIADSALCYSHLLLCSKVPILGADMRKNPSACQPGKNTPKIEQRKQTQTALTREVAAWWSVNASFWARIGEEGWGVGKSWGTTVWAASIPAKVIEKVILGIISKHTRDKETIRESQHSFTTFSHNMLTENLIKQSRQGGELKLNSQVQEAVITKLAGGTQRIQSCPTSSSSMVWVMGLREWEANVPEGRAAAQGDSGREKWTQRSCKSFSKRRAKCWSVDGTAHSEPVLGKTGFLCHILSLHQQKMIALVKSHLTAFYLNY